MKKIPVGKNNMALVDDSDFYEISKYKWFLYQGYAGREVVLNKNPRKRKVIKMHRQIMGFPIQILDHKNRNKLDNRKDNLVFSNKSENGINRGFQKNSKSGIKGVCFDKSKNGWRVFINKQGVRLVDKMFRDFNKAILFRQEMEKLHRV